MTSASAAGWDRRRLVDGDWSWFVRDPLDLEIDLHAHERGVLTLRHRFSRTMAELSNLSYSSQWPPEVVAVADTLPDKEVPCRKPGDAICRDFR